MILFGFQPSVVQDFAGPSTLGISLRIQSHPDSMIRGSLTTFSPWFWPYNTFLTKWLDPQCVYIFKKNTYQIISYTRYQTSYKSHIKYHISHLYQTSYHTINHFITYIINKLSLIIFYKISYHILHHMMTCIVYKIKYVIFITYHTISKISS